MVKSHVAERMMIPWPFHIRRGRKRIANELSIHPSARRPSKSTRERYDFFKSFKKIETLLGFAILQEKRVNEWAHLQTSHFSEVDEFDLTFAWWPCIRPAMQPLFFLLVHFASNPIGRSYQPINTNSFWKTMYGWYVSRRWLYPSERSNIYVAFMTLE